MSRRKLGSSRRSKGRQLEKDPDTDPYLQPREDFEEKTRGNKTLETQGTQLEIQDELTRDSKHGMSEMHDRTLFSDSSDYSAVKNITSPEDIVDNLVPKTGNLQTCKNDGKLEETDESNFLESEEVRVNAPIDGLSEVPESSIASCEPVNQQLMNQQEANSNMPAAAKSASNKKDDTDLFRQDGSLQSYHMVSESQISTVILESITPEITTDKHSQGENTEVKLSVGQDMLLLPKEDLPTNEKHDFEQYSEHGVNEAHDKNDKPTQILGLISSPDAKQNISPKEGTLETVGQKKGVDHVYDSKQTGNNTETGKADSSQPDRSLRVDEQSDTNSGHIGNRRKLGSRRRNKGQQCLKESKEEVLEHDEGDQALEKEKTSTTNQEELSQGTEYDVISSLSHGSSVFSLTAPSHLADVQSSSPENYAKTDLENFILKSENLPEDQHERETELNLDSSDKSVEVIPEVDKSDSLDSEDTRSHHLEDATEMQEDAIYLTPMQEILQPNNSNEPVIDNASENPETSGSLMDRFEITNPSDPTEESTGESATKQISTLVVKRSDFPTFPTLETADQISKDDRLHDFEQTRIINTECIKITIGQINQDIKHNSGQSVQQNEDQVSFESQTSNISPQTPPSESDVLPDSQFHDSSANMNEQAHAGFSQTVNRGTPHSEDALDTDDKVNSVQMQGLLERDYPPKSLPDDASVSLEITSGIITDQAEISDANHSEFIAKSTDDSTNKDLEDDLNECSTKQDVSEAVDLRNDDYEFYDVSKPQISDAENCPSSQVDEFKGRFEGDAEPSTDQIFHQEKEGPQYETKEMKPADCQPQGSSVSADEKSHKDLHNNSNKRKLGCSRRNRGKHQVKESVTEAYYKIKMEADANSSSNESTEAVLTGEIPGQENSVEIFQEEEKTGASQTEVVSSDTHVCNSELPPTDVHSASMEDQNVFEKSCYRQMPDEDFSSVNSVTDAVSKESLERTEILRHGNLQEIYLMGEPLACPVTLGVHSDENSSGKHAKDECRIEKGSPDDELSSKEEPLNEVREAHQKEHEQGTEPTHIQDKISQLDNTAEKNNDDSAVEVFSGDVSDQSANKDIKQSEFDMKTKPHHISSENRLENELGDVYEVKGQVIIMNPSEDNGDHQVSERLFSEAKNSESYSQNLQHEAQVVLDSQSQQNDTSLNPGENSGAMSSSQEKSTEIKQEGMDRSDTSHSDNVAVHGKQNVHLGTAAGIWEFTTSSPSVKQQLIKSNSRKLPDDKHPSVPPSAENEEPDEDTETLGPCGNLQGKHLLSENVEFSNQPERTTKTSSQNNQTDVEHSVEQETHSTQENHSRNRKQDEYFSPSKTEGIRDSEDVTTKHNEYCNQAQMQAMHQIGNTMITDEKPHLQTLQSDPDQIPFDAEPENTCQSFKEESHSGVKPAGNRRKLGSSRRDKTRQQAKVIKANQEFKEGVVEGKEMLTEDTTKQEELEDLMFAEKGKIGSTMSGDENTEKLLNLLDNSPVATSDINPGSDNGDTLKFNKDPDERYTEFVKEPDNASQLTGHDTVNLMQSPQVCVGKDDSHVQSIFYQDDIISPQSGIIHVLDHKEAFQCQKTEDLSREKDSQGQEDILMETVRCVTREDCKTEVVSSMDAQSPEQDEAGDKYVHSVQDTDTSQESAVDMSDESGVSAPMDVPINPQEQTHSDHNEHLQGKSKEKRRKMGSTRRTRLNRKHDEDTDGKESDFQAEAEVRGLDKLEVVEELPLTAEVVQREHTQPLHDTLKQERTEENKTLHHDEQKPQSCAFDTQSNESNVIPVFLSEQSASINPVGLNLAPDERDEEKNVDKISQLDDFTYTQIQFTSVATGTNSGASSQLLPPNTETTTGISMQTRVESIKPGQVQDADEQKPNDLHQETQCRNLEIKNPSPDLNSPNRRRKLGSTRRNLSSRTRRDGLNQQLELENKPTETPTSGENEMSESASRNEEKALQLSAENEDSNRDQIKTPLFEVVEVSHVDESISNPLVEETAEESPISQSELTKTEHGLTSTSEIAPSTPPKDDTLSELVSGGRRRKFGSNRKSRLHQNSKDQTAREARLIDDPDENVTEEDPHKATEEHREESPHLEKRSEVDDRDKKALSFRISKPASEKTPVQSENLFAQEIQRELSLADPRGTDLRSNCYNVVMVGDSSVGKTSFMKRAQTGKFSLDLPASVGLDSCMWTVVVEGKPVSLQLWDTAGQERFRSITRQIFHKAQAFLLMYDITSSQSFSAISYWANSIQEAATENVTVLLLGNKSDHAQRQVKSEQGEILAKEYNYEFLECSAATGENVIQALEIVARMLSQRPDLREEATTLHKAPEQKKRSTCC